MRFQSPEYCRPFDRENERKALVALCAHFQKTQPEHQWGYQQAEAKGALVDGSITCAGRVSFVVEVKGRRGNAARYGTWVISKRKVDNICRLAEEKQVGFLLVFTWDGEPYFCDPLKARCLWPAAIGGRNDRNDPNDTEMVYHIPRAHFAKLWRNA